MLDLLILVGVAFYLLGKVTAGIVVVALAVVGKEIVDQLRKENIRQASAAVSADEASVAKQV
jgi:hypothetical protein